MPTYVIAKRDTELLETPVFQAGEAGDEEAIAVFTRRENAQQYIDQADWATDHEVGQLDHLQLLRWVMQAYEMGTQYLVINPEHQGQVAGRQQMVIVIEEKLDAFAETLTGDVLQIAEQE